MASRARVTRSPSRMSASAVATRSDSARRRTAAGSPGRRRHVREVAPGELGEQAQGQAAWRPAGSAPPGPAPAAARTRARCGEQLEEGHRHGAPQHGHQHLLVERLPQTARAGAGRRPRRRSAGEERVDRGFARAPPGRAIASVLSAAGAAPRRRVRRSSSAMRTLTSPSPVTAPRVKAFSRRSRTAGCGWSSQFESHSDVQGATRSTSPTRSELRIESRCGQGLPGLSCRAPSWRTFSRHVAEGGVLAVELGEDLERPIVLARLLERVREVVAEALVLVLGAALRPAGPSRTTSPRAWACPSR